MRGRNYAVLFLLIFTAFIAAPTVMSIIKSDADTSIFFSLAEEENKSSTSSAEKDYVFSHYRFSNYYITDSKKNNADFVYVDNYYPSIVLNQHCPPPEQEA
ncbi:hypothetical protein SAMN04487906_1572 [Zhouia amylolytica]|uniref:Uncharacterized protein n=2 Tax=Zhouia amylolytica TaxID=376730 RepID=W2UL06_9FLAO|nr:hypothetical protein [Zhouia amylolytica]ETN94688.1 hypothetical protein P278_26310 [Zhouia amylolytica AD3]MCQ0110870.1 hypothetical protein [Zhouia amylolytica]SFS75541.1 hypothetical protein SAMN04487906_1572 [Zhouia amylolytica]